MLSTLHRYIFQELIRVFIPATLAMTLILSLSSLLQPIQEYGINPTQAMRLLFYLLPTTLTFILPITAVFGAALTYGRLAGDNEIDACKTSGISPFSIVYPGIVLAILVAITNLILSFHIMPSFVRRAEELIRTDAKQILFRNLQRSGYYKLPPDNRYIIYADEVDPQKNLLIGVVVVDSKQGAIKKIVAADSATVSFQVNNNGSHTVHITAQEAIQIGLESDTWFHMKSISLQQRFGSVLGDKIDFKTLNEIKHIRADLMSFYPINRWARDAIAQYTNDLLLQDIHQTINTGHSYELIGEPNSIRFIADECSLGQEKQIKLSGNIEMTEYNRASGQILRTLQCEKASLYVQGDEFQPTLIMDIINANDIQSQEIMIRYIVRQLQLPEAIRHWIPQDHVLSRLNETSLGASLREGPSQQLKQLITTLDWVKRKALADIKAEFHWRLVLGLGCIPMIIIGLALGIIQKGGHMLSAFGAAFVPAIILVVAIVSGKQVTENLSSHGVSGPAIMWTGLAMLFGLMLILFRRLVRH
jgi:lipopolysaccharide export LptBFGC system permease protein LptF